MVGFISMCICLVYSIYIIFSTYIIAGQFIGNHIEDFLKNGGKWLHVDMAGPVSSGERATGYGVALLFK